MQFVPSISSAVVQLDLSAWFKKKNLRFLLIPCPALLWKALAVPAGTPRSRAPCRGQRGGMWEMREDGQSGTGPLLPSIHQDLL